MDIFEILNREHSLIKRYLSELEEMTYSVSVNTRDFSSLFRRLCIFWDEHEEKEEKLFRLLAEEGFRAPVEEIKFSYGDLARIKESIMDAIDSGEESRIKAVLENQCGELIDILKAHILAEDSFLKRISWKDIRSDVREKIELLQIIPSDKILFED